MLDKILDKFRGNGGGGGPAPSDPHDLVEQLRAQYGTNAAASRATGIPDSTLRRWFNGAKPSRQNIEKAERATRDVSTRRLSVDGFAIETRDNKDGRTRTIRAEKLGLTQADLDRVRDRMVRGDEAGARAEFLKGVSDPWYRQYLNPNSKVSRTGTADGIGGGPEGAVSRGLWRDSGEDASDDYEDTEGLEYEGLGADETDAGAEYGGQVSGVVAAIIAFATSKNRS